MTHKNVSPDLFVTSGRFSREADYWVEKFSGFPGKNVFPYDMPVKKEDTGQMKEYAFFFPREISSRILDISAGSDIRLHMILTAGLSVLMNKYALNADTGNDITIAVPVYKQKKQGRFVNTVLALRNRWDEKTTFKELLLQVRRTISEAVDHRNYPIEMLVKRLNLPAHGMEFPLFDVALMLENIHDRAYFRDVFLNMIFAFQRKEDTVTGVVHYNKSRYLGSTVKRISGHFCHMLRQALSDIDTETSALEAMPDEEKQRILVKFNSAGTAAGESGRPGTGKEPLVHELFEKQVEKTPDTIAAVGAGQLPGTPGKVGYIYLSYKELNQIANRLAHLLRAGGVTADTLVALMVDPSVETAIGIMGILKAGGAYLPIHHETPPERIKALLKDGEVSLLITRDHILRSYSYTMLQGLGDRERPVVRTKPRGHITDFDSLAMPDRSLVDYEKYNQYIGHNLINNCISLQATRGCPYNCAYCHKLWPKKHVFRSAENVFEEVLFNYKLGTRRFSFVDDIFNFDRENSRRFFELIIDRELDLQLFSMMRGDLLNRDYIDLMVKAGLKRLALALETASPRLQKLIGKRLDIEKLKTNLEYIAHTYPDIILELYTMHGFPTETEEEAMMTLNFIKSIRWLHFPYIFVLTIYPNTDMEKLAVENGVSPAAIERSLNQAYHQLPETLPFDRGFSVNYQTGLLNDYFLSRERLLQVLPRQMKILTESEIVQKYNSYLPVNIESFDNLLDFLEIRKEELAVKECLDEREVFVPGLNAKLRKAFGPKGPGKNALRLLLLDLSQHFKGAGDQLADLIEPPLGLMYLLTYLNQQYPGKINGKIAKSMIDFDNFNRLKKLLDTFKPQVIGIRTLSYYKDFFHRTVWEIRQWDDEVPIITGGPYATSSYKTLLQDPNVDLVVFGEGELTLAEIIREIMANDGKLPAENVLKDIAGIAFIPGKEKKRGKRGPSTREIILLDDLTSADPNSVFGTYPSGDPRPVNQPHHLAYTIFTSGSSGRPKGVMLEHRSLNRLVYGLKERIYSRYITADHPGTLNISLVAPYVFDASVKQIFGTLLQGHTLHIVPPPVRVDGPALLRFYNDFHIDISDGTPTLVRMILESLELVDFLPRRLKHLVIGGEALRAEHAHNLLKRRRSEGKTLEITNVYGPTECTVDNTSYPVTLPGPGSQNIKYNEIPIGRPMPFDWIYILDPGRKNRVQPIGVPGELYIGGPKVARGYLNNPELTAEKFVETNKKLYRTGDMARWSEDGSIEFLGRRDLQVKIRGLRIELEEIENRLAAIGSIKEAVVTTGTDNGGSNYLCAYIVPEKKKDREMEISRLRHILSEHLPDYMIPAHFVLLEELPLTESGKIDRQAIPAPDEAGLGGGSVLQEAPRNEVEEKLVEILKKILGRKRVGIHENIFMAGGDSIKTLQIAAGMKKVGYKVEIKDIFENPTAAGLAPKVEKIKRLADQSVVTGAVPLSPVQEEFFDTYKIDSHHYNQAVLFYSRERLDPGALEETVIKLQEHHDALRMTCKKEDGRMIQWNHGLDYAHWFNVYSYFDNPRPVEALEKTCDEIQASFDLEKGPLLKVALFRLDDGDRLLVVLHHLVVDGLSWRILIQDINTLYHHFKNHKHKKAGQPLSPLLPPKSDSFKSWTEGLRRYADSRELLNEKAYWGKIESMEIGPIAKDFKIEKTLIRDMESQSISLDEGETENLLTRVNAVLGTEVTDVLLTGLASAFKKAFGIRRLLVALEGHGREAIIPGVDVTRTIGWFTSVFPVLLDVPVDLELSLRVHKIQKILRRVPNKGIGYGILKYLTADEHKEDIRFKLKPQVNFNYLGQFATDVDHTSFQIAAESYGESLSLRGMRKYEFTFTGLVYKQLSISVLYSKKQYKAETVAGILGEYKKELQAVISYCCT